MSFYQETRRGCKTESFFTSGKQKKIDFFLWTVIVITVKQCSKQWECYYQFCPCQEARPSLTKQDIERGIKKREIDDMRQEEYI